MKSLFNDKIDGITFLGCNFLNCDEAHLKKQRCEHCSGKLSIEDITVITDVSEDMSQVTYKEINRPIKINVKCPHCGCENSFECEEYIIKFG